MNWGYNIGSKTKIYLLFIIILFNLSIYLSKIKKLMKKIYTLLIMIGIFLQASLLSAQEQRVVKVAGWDPESTENITDYVDALLLAIDADADAREQNPNVIYELERGKLYPHASRVVPNFDLHIRGEEGDGPLPMIINWPTSTGAWLDYFRPQKNFTMEYIHLDGYNQEGGVANRAIKCYGVGSRITIRGCIIDGDRGAAIASYDDDMKIYITDVVAGNLGHRKTIGGNGRLLDLRATNSVDTVVILNTTTYSNSDRVVRNMGPVVNYIEIDHLTAFNIIGFHGTLQLGKAKNAIVKNSVFANTQLTGDNPMTTEQTQPEKSFFVITLDTIYPDGNYEIRNNNIFWDQEVIDMWAQIDSVNVPGFVNPTLLAAAATTLEDATFSEHLTLANVCAPPVAYIAATFANPEANEFPENWCVGVDGGIYPEDIDVSYNETAISYTAADMGYPVGDLNFFPELKSLWEEGFDLSTVSVNEASERQAILAYPNPVKDILYLNQKVDEIIIYDIVGKQVLSVQNVQSINVSDLSRGVYMITMTNGKQFNSHKILINR